MIADRKSASHGEAGYERRAFEFYPTEPWVTRALLNAVDFRLPAPDDTLWIWEPACGDGRMAEVLKEAGYLCYASDIVQHGDYECRWNHDFLTGPRLIDCAAIVTNPPFGTLARRFIQRALDFTRDIRGKVAILQRHDFDAPKTNWPLFEAPFAAKLILHKRPLWIDDQPADGKKASPRFPFAWFLWDWRHRGPPIIRFLPDPDTVPKAVGLLL